MEKEIFFCENNVSKGLEEIVERLKKEYEKLEIYIEPCQGQCSLCAERYFAIIDSELIEGKTSEELYENIKEFLEE